MININLQYIAEGTQIFGPNTTHINIPTLIFWLRGSLRQRVKRNLAAG